MVTPLDRELQHQQSEVVRLLILLHKARVGGILDIHHGDPPPLRLVLPVGGVIVSPHHHVALPVTEGHTFIIV